MASMADKALSTPENSHAPFHRWPKAEAGDQLGLYPSHTHTKQHLLGIKQWLGFPVLPSAGEDKQPGKTAVCSLAAGIWGKSWRGKALALYRLSKLECEGMKSMNRRLVLSVRFALEISRFSVFC